MAHGSEAENSYTGWFFRDSAVHCEGESLAAACGRGVVCLALGNNTSLRSPSERLDFVTDGCDLSVAVQCWFDCLWPELVWGLVTCVLVLGLVFLLFIAMVWYLSCETQVVVFSVHSYDLETCVLRRLSES